jgi:hypothetical protein
MAIDFMDQLLNPNAQASATEVDEAAESQGALPPGKYHARLDTVTNKEVGGIKVANLEFRVLAGKFKGRKVSYQLWYGTSETDKEGNPKSQEELEEAKRRIQNEFWHAASVLGLAAKVTTVDGKTVYKLVAGKKDFRDCIPNECIVETKIRKYTTAKGVDGEISEVKMFGLMGLDDPKAKDVAKLESGATRPSMPLPGEGGSGAKQKSLADIV